MPTYGSFVCWYCRNNISLPNRIHITPINQAHVICIDCRQEADLTMKEFLNNNLITPQLLWYYEQGFYGYRKNTQALKDCLTGLNALKPMICRLWLESLREDYQNHNKTTFFYSVSGGARIIQHHPDWLVLNFFCRYKGENGGEGYIDFTILKPDQQITASNVVLTEILAIRDDILYFVKTLFPHIVQNLK
jgi:hypothetical protein